MLSLNESILLIREGGYNQVPDDKTAVVFEKTHGGTTVRLWRTIRGAWICFALHDGGVQGRLNHKDIARVLRWAEERLGWVYPETRQHKGDV